MYTQQWKIERERKKAGQINKKRKIKQVHYCLTQHIRQDYQEFNLHETSHIYKKDLHRWGLHSLYEPRGPVAKQSMAVTIQVKWGGGVLAGNAIITTISLDTGAH